MVDFSEEYKQTNFKCKTMSFRLSRIKDFSLNILKTHPIKSATVSCGVFGIGGDLLCQRLEWNFYKNDKNGTLPNSYDLKRTAEFAFNATLYGPFNYYWYRWLDGRYPTRSVRHMTKKIGIDLLFAIVYYPVWFTTYSAIKSYSGPPGSFSLTKIAKDCQEKIPVLLSFDIVLWPVLQTLNFGLLRPEYRVIGTKCSELVFDVIMSYVGNNDITMQDLYDYATGSKTLNIIDEEVHEENSKHR